MPDAVNSGQPSDGTSVLSRFLESSSAWLSRRADERGLAWFRSAIEDIAEGAGERALVVAIGLAPRRLGKADLSLTADELAEAQALRPGLDPSDWSIDQLARIALMAAGHRGDDAAFATRFDSFCTTAEINELIALCRGLPIYPNPRLFERRAREAVRSGMKPVFEAVAHRNPYPREIFEEDAWNHMVVKAIFIESTLWPIQGLDERANPRLARMLVDLAQERWAAQRPVSVEMWRCVAPHADREGIKALLHAWNTGGERDRLAVALAHKNMARVDEELPAKEMTDLQARIASEKIDWPALA
jgi:hypothetical protein